MPLESALVPSISSPHFSQSQGHRKTLGLPSPWSRVFRVAGLPPKLEGRSGPSPLRIPHRAQRPAATATPSIYRALQRSNACLNRRRLQRS
jgi:hypothetical protein